MIGGTGDQLLGGLDPFNVFGALMPEGGTVFNARLGSSQISGVELVNGETEYLIGVTSTSVPEPGILILIAMGMVGIGLARRRGPHL